MEEAIINLLKRCKEHNFYIVLFTASDPIRFPFMHEYMNARGVQVDAINENPIPLPFGNHRKIYYNIFLDDRAGLSSATAILAALLHKIDREGKEVE